MFCTVSNKHTQNEITRIKQKYSNDNQKARRKIIELQPQNFIYSFQVKLNKTTYLSFKHIMCRFMIESDNVTDNLVFAVNSLITLYQIRHFYLLAKWRPRCARRHARPHWHQRFRPLSFTISGESARRHLWSKKHGANWSLLTPIGPVYW